MFLYISGYEIKEDLESKEKYQRLKDEVNHFDDRLDGFAKTFKKEVNDGFKQLRDDVKNNRKIR